MKQTKNKLTEEQFDFLHEKLEHFSNELGMIKYSARLRGIISEGFYFDEDKEMINNLIRRYKKEKISA